MLDLKYGSLVVYLIPPCPTRRASGPRMSTPNACQVALGRPYFDHFSASILSSILVSFWARLGVVLGSSWWPFAGPNQVKFRQKCVLNRHFFENVDFHETFVKPLRNCQKCLQDMPKIASRRIQGGSKTGPRARKKRCIFRLDFCLVLGCLLYTSPSPRD